MRDFLRETGVLLIGVGLGGLLVEQTSLFAATCVLGIVLVVGSGILGSAERRFQQSEALDLVFEGDGTPCVQAFDIITALPDYEQPRQPAIGVRVRREPATTLRLHAKNLRSRRLGQVRVRLRNIRPVTGAQPEHYSDWLKWTHDDSPAHPASLLGRQIEPGIDRDAYLDFVTKAHHSNDFVVEFAMSHLRQEGFPATPHYIHIVATGVDEATGRSFPAYNRAFLFEVDADGKPLITSKTMADLRSWLRQAEEWLRR
jgi:hypothetical protein